MKCPNCGKEVTERSLVKRARSIYSGFALSRTQLFCPNCDAEVAYTAKTIFFVVGGFIVFVLCALVPLATDVSGSKKIGLAVFGALSAFASAIYRTTSAELRLVENNEI
jgi:hypothetical protein